MFFVQKKYPMGYIAAFCNRPQRGGAIEAAIDPAAPVDAEDTGRAAVEGLPVGTDELPDFRHARAAHIAISWYTIDPMQKQTWASAADYSDRISAEAALTLLLDDGVPAYIASNAYVPGLGSDFAVLVPADSLHRARRILQVLPLSERELTYLATGELIDT